MRVDVALYGLRLFKSRSQAQEAIAAGRVLIGATPVKPSHELRAGDRVTLLGDGTKRTVEVLDLPHRSLSKDAARALLRDLPTA